MTDDIPTFKVGDTVTLVKRTHRRYEPEAKVETTVTKVGRKYFWVEAAYPYQKFHLDSGTEVSNFSAACYVTTPERDAAETHRAELIASLGELGVKFDWHSRKLSSKTLEILLEAVSAEGGS